ncbi:hypothetical protein N1851_008870 [Merluccius polli]|uniref:Uncharacterized protein n=1 Tax=Merluccius polli TaxID=89951 RepID=A0AA47P8F2_MERPO|nr:hypothetical protein N1851_008870 [Merluccius polli]
MTTETKRSTFFNALELEVLMLAYGEYEPIFRRRCNTAAAAKEREKGEHRCPSQRSLRSWPSAKTGVALRLEASPGEAHLSLSPPQDTSAYIRCKYTYVFIILFVIVNGRGGGPRTDDGVARS